MPRGAKKLLQPTTQKAIQPSQNGAGRQRKELMGRGLDVRILFLDRTVAIGKMMKAGAFGPRNRKRGKP